MQSCSIADCSQSLSVLCRKGFGESGERLVLLILRLRFNAIGGTAVSQIISHVDHGSWNLIEATTLVRQGEIDRVTEPFELGGVADRG